MYLHLNGFFKRGCVAASLCIISDISLNLFLLFRNSSLSVSVILMTTSVSDNTALISIGRTSIFSLISNCSYLHRSFYKIKLSNYPLQVYWIIRENLNRCLLTKSSWLETSQDQCKILLLNLSSYSSSSSSYSASSILESTLDESPSVFASEPCSSSSSSFFSLSSSSSFYNLQHIYYDLILWV